jgi:predicted SAM-dependent methyltransferase
MVKLHLGSGKRIIPGYINVDIQPILGVNLLSDLRTLPIQDNSVDFFYSCANIEHFGRREWKTVLANWYAKLKPGGTLRVSTADFQAAVERYLEVGDVEELLGLVIGGQKDDYDWHGMIFDFSLLARGLTEVGFINVRRYDWQQTELAQLGIDDYSQAYLPHMDKENGRLMMLNVLADKPA